MVAKDTIEIKKMRSADMARRADMARWELAYMEALPKLQHPLGLGPDNPPQLPREG